MDFRILVAICILTCIKCEDCGRLRVNYEDRKLNSIDARIRLYPSDSMKTYITEKQFYRWLIDRGTGYHEILQKNINSSFDHIKYHEESQTLTVRDLTQADEGKYTVQCWKDRMVFYSDIAVLKIPEIITTTLSSYSPAALTKPTVNSTPFIVVAVSAVLVVLIIAATVCVIWRKRHTKKDSSIPLGDGGRHLPSVDFQRQENDSESIYNEIDIELDYAKVNNSGIGIEKHILFEKSPALPDRPLDRSEQSNTYEYASVNEVEHSEIKHTNESDSFSSNKNINHTDNYEEKGQERLVYAQVQKQKRREGNERPFEASRPSIDSLQLRDSPDEYRTEPHQHKNTQDNGPTYSNLASCSTTQKSTERKSTRLDLQYAILNLSDTEAVLMSIEPVKTQCQYADIDFESKAFVAPLRKAPSSWYKRKKKNGKH